MKKRCVSQTGTSFADAVVVRREGPSECELHARDLAEPFADPANQDRDLAAAELEHHEPHGRRARPSTKP